MTHNVPFKFLILLSIFSCTKDKDFETQTYPILHTLGVTKISPEGATLNGEILKLGQEEILRYGFVFDPDKPDIGYSDTVLLTRKANDGTFSITLDDAFADSLKYKVRVFAITTNRVIYGNTVEFQSQGSKWNPWIFRNKVFVDDWEIISASNNENAFLITAFQNLYFYNPDANLLTLGKDVPIDVYGASDNAMACYLKGKYLYEISNYSSQLLRFDITNNNWTGIGSKPFNPMQTFGFVLKDTGYFISRGNLYAYDEPNNSWIKKTAISSTNIIYSALVADNNLYVFTNNQEIWKYTPLSDSWQKETAFPGIWHGHIMGISVNNKLYYGLSYSGYGGDIPPAKDFWEYTIGTKSWKKMKNFPLSPTKLGMINFSIKESGFLGYFDYSLHRLFLYKFDPNKIKQ
jgi:hypothetical protein